MRVDPNDGRCRTCGDTLAIIAADDATMTVEFIDCGHSYAVELDAFGDGAIEYYPGFLPQQLEREHAEEET